MPEQFIIVLLLSGPRPWNGCSVVDLTSMCLGTAAVVVHVFFFFLFCFFLCLEVSIPDHLKWGIEPVAGKTAYLPNQPNISRITLEYYMICLPEKAR